MSMLYLTTLAEWQYSLARSDHSEELSNNTNRPDFFVYVFGTGIRCDRVLGREAMKKSRYTEEPILFALKQRRGRTGGSEMSVE
jgi:hypothetical protein